MKKQTFVLFIATIALACSVQAQPGRMSGPKFNGAIAKLFGDNTAFSADLEIHVAGEQDVTMPGKMAFDSGKSRFEMNLSDAKGSHMPPNVAERMKAMGMDQTVVISRPDAKVSYLVYPGLNAYAETPLQDSDAGKPDSAFKMETTELGKETLDGHACVKNKVIITDDEGKPHESTVWNASDLKKFPIKIEMNENGNATTMLFKNVKTSKPDAALFEPPQSYKKYDNQMSLMQQEMMKRMGGGGGMPPGHQ
ncbi:MAG TPA: DUF4412 domain-containing protein [Verrucomicrobiae bacterium]|jgi:hypothetical protein|nr:DUF4412 domain-containing protein [Verrucomicrobiae bacterium]